MNLTAILLLGLLGAPIAAGAALISKKAGVEWTPLQRVFNSAAIAPAIIAVGSAGFAAVILTMGGGHKYDGAALFLIQAITTVLVTFVTGMIAAYLLERP